MTNEMFHPSTYVTMITVALFEAEDRRLNGIISSLNQRNKRLYDAKVDGFLHAGQFYLPKDATLRSAGGIAKTPLHSSLQDEMESFLKDKRVVQEEQGFIKQILHTIIAPCRTEQQVRDTLPECLVNCFSTISRLPRMDEMAFTIRGNPRAIRQFEKFLPKMELYSALKLLY